MTGGTRISGQAYYDVMPGSDLQVGDIWNEMPTFGHWKFPTTSGVVITPACDLSNNKTETVTFLPIVSLEQYLTGRSFAVELVRVIKAQDPIAGLGVAADWTARTSKLPNSDVLQRVQAAAKIVIEKKGVGEKTLAAAKRCEAAVKTLLSYRISGRGRLSDVRFCLGDKEFARILADVVRNAYSGDIHFLPSDGRIGVTSAMRTHSLALFRYPMSLPVEILQVANDIGVVDWGSAIRSIQPEYPIADSVKNRPIKVGTLRAPYLADLISRFATLHVRMGSPDFTKETVMRYVQDIQGAV